MTVLADLPAITLAVLLVWSAVLKLSHRPGVVASYARVGVPERMLNPLAFLLLSGAAGLVAGLWWEGVGIAATAGVASYFLVAIGAHVRTRQLASVGTPVVIELLAVAVLILESG